MGILVRMALVVLCLLFVGPSHAQADEATVLETNVLELMDQGKFAEAIPLAERCVELRKKSLERHDPNIRPIHPADYATSINNLAYLYQALGQYEKALPLYQRSLEIYERVLGPEAPGTATGINNLAILYENMSQFDKALPLLQRALAINEKIDPEDAATANSLNSLAMLYLSMSQFDKALPLLQRALAIRKKIGPEDAAAANVLHNLALLYQNMSQFDKALPLYQRALEIKKKTLGEAHPDYATSLENLGVLYASLGDYSKSTQLIAEASLIRKKTLGENHPLYVGNFERLADVLFQMGDYPRALSVYLKVFAISQKAYEKGDSSYLNMYLKSLQNVSNVYQWFEQYDKALPYAQSAVIINAKVFGPEHANTATSLNNLAVLYQTLGRYDQALPLYRRALAITEKVLGPEHAATATSLNNLASFHGIQHHSAEALDHFARAQRVTDHVIDHTFPILTEQQKLQFAQQQEGGYFGMLSLIHRQMIMDANAVRAGLDVVLSRKGIVFDAQARQGEAIARSLNPQTRILWDELSSQRSMLAKLMQSGLGKMKPEDYQARIKSLQDEIAKLEGQLASKSALVAEELKQRKVTSKEVAKTLSRDTALVEYVKIQDFDWGKGKWADTWRYLAFVLKGDGTVRLIDLGDAGKLEADVQAAIKAIGNVGSSSDAQQAGTRQLNELLWQPIASAVGDAGKVVFSPDGILNLVPFAAMQDKDGKYLIEARQVGYVTSGRDLAKGDTGIRPQSELYLAANPRFDLKGIYNSQPSETRGVIRSVDFNLQFGPLPGTELEAKEIPGFLQGRKRVVMGKDATEASVLNVQRPKVMHLATHGFFLQDQPELTAGARDGKAIMQPMGNAAPQLPKGYENPLVRSGLAFAGANHAREAKGGMDGLLTALEVSGMDLHGTDLVTLSACETGRGDVKSGEGVFGLRRAFALAGTKNLVMSLWPVSDDVTAQQMGVLYREYGNGRTPVEALRQAQLETIASLRSKSSFASPALWAPFIVQGQ